VASSVLTKSPTPTVVVPPTDAPRVSFVLVAYGTGHILIETLASIVSTTGTIPYEVIVVDNPHPRAVDRSYTELLLHTHGVRVLRPDANLGFGGGCNAGAELARGATLAFVNPDVTLSEGWLERLLRVLDEGPAVWLVAPTLLDDDGSIQECGQVLYADGTTRPLHRRPDVPEPFDVDYASAACWLVRADRFRELDGFDEAFHPAYFEDVDFALRVQQAGGRCVVDPRAEVTHHAGSGTPDRPPPAHTQRQLLQSKWPELATSRSVPPSG
jgi:GT2 family glycosyltransferase